MAYLRLLIAFETIYIFSNRGLKGRADISLRIIRRLHECSFIMILPMGLRLITYTSFETRLHPLFDFR